MRRWLPVILLILSTRATSLGLDLHVRDFPTKTCGAPAGEFWNLWSNGFAAQWVRFHEDGEYRIDVEAFGQPARQIWPVMRICIDLEPAAEIGVKREDAKTYSVSLKVTAGVRRLSIHFLNDYYSPDRKEDRNLFLGKVRIRPEKDGASDPAVADTPDWREGVETRIAHIRMGDLVLEVAGKDGKPLLGVRVRARLLRHAFPFGCAVSTGFVRGRWSDGDRENYARLFNELFNHAVHENALKWHVVNRRGPEPDFSEADRILAWCSSRNISMRGHCLLWANERCVPSFARKLADGELRDAVGKRIEEVLRHYRGKIADYDLNNEMIHLNYFTRRLGLEFRPWIFKKAREVSPGVPMYVNDFNILSGGDLEKYVKHIEGLLEAGAPVGGIGCQAHFGRRIPDPLAVKMALDRLAKFGLPIKITEFDIDSADEGRQALDLYDFYRVCFSHHAVSGILMWGFWEGAHWRPRAALFARDWRPKPAAVAYRRLILHEWHTDLGGVTDGKGVFKGRGFFGDYEVRIETKAGGETVRTVRFPREGSGMPFTIEVER